MSGTVIAGVIFGLLVAGGAFFGIHRYRIQRSLVPWREADTQFIDRGMQYYIAGRFCALTRQFPVCANLLHHAIEMFLKGVLCRTHSRAQLQLMGHNIWRAWVAFKAQHPDPRLAQLDTTVKSLGKFQRIRYPDDVLRRGATITFDVFHEAQTQVQSYSAAPSPTYRLNLEDVDSVVALLFELARINPHFFLVKVSPAAREALNDRNRHPFPVANPSARTPPRVKR